MPPFKFSTHIEVRFRDLDALGHVNNAVYLTYFEIARLHYWKKLFGSEAFSRHGFVVVRAECNYRSSGACGRIAPSVREKFLNSRSRVSFLSIEIVESRQDVSSPTG